jgi:hypothetical protein
MRQKKARSIRKYVANNFPPGKERIKAESLMKGFKKQLYLISNCPKNPKPLSKKMKPGESYANFKIRRKASNKRRRERESLCRT